MYLIFKNEMELDISKTNRNVILKMLRKEQEMRYSNEIQDIYMIMA